MHSLPDVDTDSRKQKSNVILLYNKNKVGVDSFDQMTRPYTTRCASRRWPLSVWENILNITAINAKILFVKCTGNLINRRQFIFQLMKNLRSSRNQKVPVHLHLCRFSCSLPRSQKKMYGKSFNNATTYLCLSCTKPNSRTCFDSGSKETFVKCKYCSSRV